VLPDSSSSQASLMVFVGTNQSAGTTVALVDSDGNTVVSYDPLVTYSCVIFSSENLTVGETYTVMIGGSELCTVTLSQTSMAVDSSGNQTTVNSMGGMGGGAGSGQEGGGQAPGGQAPGGAGGPGGGRK